MAQSPLLKVHNPSGEYVASCKVFEDAAMLVGCYGAGAKIKHAHVGLIWNEGSEVISASDSYDEATRIMRDRIRSKHRAALVRNYGEERVAQFERDGRL